MKDEKKNNTLKLNGRAGNQFFQYAAALAIKEKYNFDEIRVSFPAYYVDNNF